MDASRPARSLGRCLVVVCLIVCAVVTVVTFWHQVCAILAEGVRLTGMPH